MKNIKNKLLIGASSMAVLLTATGCSNKSNSEDLKSIHIDSSLLPDCSTGNQFLQPKDVIPSIREPFLQENDIMSYVEPDSINYSFAHDDYDYLLSELDDKFIIDYESPSIARFMTNFMANNYQEEYMYLTAEEVAAIFAQNIYVYKPSEDEALYNIVFTENDSTYKLYLSWYTDRYTVGAVINETVTESVENKESEIIKREEIDVNRGTDYIYHVNRTYSMIPSKYNQQSSQEILIDCNYDIIVPRFSQDESKIKYDDYSCILTLKNQEKSIEVSLTEADSKALTQKMVATINNPITTEDFLNNNNELFTQMLDDNYTSYMSTNAYVLDTKKLLKK